MYILELRLDRLPGLRLNNREIIAARLIPADTLYNTMLTGPVAAYLASRPPLA